MAYENKSGYVSVTTVLGPFIDTRWFGEESRIRGTVVHAACCAFAGGLYHLPLPAEWQGYLDSFKKWCELARPEPLRVEERLVDHHLGLSGQPDFIGRIHGRLGIGIIDFKTAQSSAKWWPLQGAGYRHLAKVNDITTEWGFDLRLRADGATAIATMVDEWPADYRSDLNVLISAMNCYRYFNRR
jgi:hypothetical protein